MQKNLSRSPQSFDALTLRALLESAAAGIVIIDSAGIMHAVNRAAARLFGHSEPELIGNNVSMLMPEPYRSAHDAYIARYLATGESRIVGIGRDVTGERADGSHCPMHLSVGEFVADGERFFTGILADLSAQRQAELRSEREHAFFRSVVECMPDPLLIADLDRRVRVVNPAFTHVFGIPAEQLIGKSCESIYATPEEYERHCRLGCGVAGVGNPQTHVVQLRRSNGEVFPGAALRAMIVDSAGREHGYLECIRDISDERRREAQLVQAQRMEAIGQLTGGVAHDFNNILTVILGNIELLETRLSTDLDQGLAREAREAADMGARLTDRLLTFGRRQLLETQQINLNQFVLEMTGLLRRTIGADIDLSTALAGDLWPTEADPAQVENAVLNLAINSRDAMPSGGRLLIETRNVSLDARAVEPTPELQPGDYVVLSVSDTGHGMPDSVKARAFEPFFTTKGAGKGSGLGLATIYGFVKQTGGHATIYSEVGKGTVVNLYFPRAVSDAVEPTDAGASGDVTHGQGQTILVVEDDERVRRLTTRRLEAMGYRVVEARNGVEGLELLAAGAKVDLVFTDLVMPGGLSGLDLLREVRTHFPGVAMLLTSGYSEDLVGSVSGTADDVLLLRKPYRQSDLAAALQSVLARR
ncbi:MAG: PAS domain S-box protein [Pseudomonadota bacterium]